MKLFRKKEEKKTELEKVEERREEVLATGRKFKYPLQWTKHRVVVGTILVSFAMIALLLTAGWLALYKFGMTDELLYRVTEIIPVSVAEVDGEPVRFSDYLMLYRSSMTSIERQSGQVDDEETMHAMRTQFKQTALREVEEYAFALKLAKELGISVSNEEVTEEFNKHRQVGGVDRSEASFLKIIKDNFGLSKDEYSRLIYLKLVETKVKAEIDDTAKAVAEKVEQTLASNGGIFSSAAEALGDQISYEETGGMVSNKNIDGGRSSVAMTLEEGTASGRFLSMNGDGYYFVKLVKKSETEVNFVSIKVPFNEFETRFSKLVEEEKIREFIEIE